MDVKSRDNNGTGAKRVFYVILIGLIGTYLSNNYPFFTKVKYIRSYAHTPPFARSPFIRQTNQRLINVTDQSPVLQQLGKANTTDFVQLATNSTNGISAQLHSINLQEPTSPYFTHFTLKSVREYKLCDTLEITIEAKNKRNERKSFGGDYFWAWIHNKNLRASAAAEDIIDYGNGSYSARFRLYWSGETNIAVKMIFSSEAISVLKRLRDNYPARFSYVGKFIWEKKTMITPCHITPDMYVDPRLTPANRSFCNYTDIKTGFPWFCVKRAGWPCDSYVSHQSDSDRAKKFQASLMSKTENQLFTRPKTIYSLSSNIVDVQSDNNKTHSTCKASKLVSCSLGLSPRPRDSIAGFYYEDVWNSLVCNNQKFTIPQIRKCLQNQSLHFWGDSTSRQWYEYFVALLGINVEQHKAENPGFGPNIAVDKIYNISFHFHFHSYPNRVVWTSVANMRYVPNMIDDIPSGGNQVIVLTLWAHFTATNLDLYKTRWKVIKDAILRLKMRNPGACVVIKSANTRYPGGVDYNNWYSWELDKVMRNMMSEFDDVTIIDVWDMTMGHRTGFVIHPTVEIISQEISMLLSFLCPKTQ